MKKIFIIIITVFCFSASFSQTKIENKNIEISSTIIDAQTSKPLIYASIVNINSQKGTASNKEGFFKLPYNNFGDYIEISFIGYKTKKIKISQNFPDKIKLNPKFELLQEAVVIGNNDYLYKILSRVKNLKSKRIIKSKTYYYLETFVDNDLIELIEAYYNGAYSGYDLKNIEYKKGRIGNKPFDNRRYISLETSKVFYLYQLFNNNSYFPKSPLNLNYSQLKKKYDLLLISELENEKGKTYQINFTPKQNFKKELFTGTIWIDVTNNKIEKINLRITSPSVNPFVFLGIIDTVLPMSINISKTFNNTTDNTYLKAMNFDYKYIYKDNFGKTHNIKTQAFIKPYDRENLFNLPLFIYSDAVGNDYRNIGLANYDEKFWNSKSEFSMNDNIEKKNTFFKSFNISDTTQFLSLSRSDKHPNGLFEYSYIKWSKKRLIIKEATNKEIENAQKNHQFLSDRYNINAQIYIDVNTIKDTVSYVISSIIDPVNTYYYFVLNNSTHAFLNMYFDLVEIEKRKLKKEIDATNDLNYKKIKNLYEKTEQNLNIVLNEFKKQVDRGNNYQAMKKWNVEIRKELQIDNIEIFGINNNE